MKIAFERYKPHMPAVTMASITKNRLYSVRLMSRDGRSWGVNLTVFKSTPIGRDT